MTDEQRHSADVLNRLFVAEAGCLARRLPELRVDLAHASADQVMLVERLACMGQEHLEWLATAIEDSGGVVAPAPINTHTSSLHYLSVEALLPRVEKSLDMLVAEYADAARQKPLTLAAAELIDRIRARHEADLAGLRQHLPAPG